MFPVVPNTQSPPVVTPPSGPAPIVRNNLNSTVAVALDTTTGNVLYTKNRHLRFDMPASTVKMLTHILLVELKPSSLGQLVTIVANDLVPPSYSRVNFNVGDIVSLNDLLLSSIVISAADSCLAIARTLGNEQAGYAVNDIRGYEIFVNMMNERARQLGLSRSFFMGSNGAWVMPTTAYDMALLTAVHFANSIIRPEGLRTTYSFSVTGPFARAINITDTSSQNIKGDTNLIGSKFGFWNIGQCASYSLACLWRAPNLVNEIAIVTLGTQFFGQTQAVADQRALVASLATDFPYLA